MYPYKESAAVKTTPTEEQASVINYKGNLLVVEAAAGSGKTFTLVNHATVNSHERILYLVLNKAMQLEAEKRFPANTKVLTHHALAFRMVGHNFKHKLSNNMSLRSLMNATGLSDPTDAAIVKKTLETFISSSDDTLANAHYPHSAPITLNAANPITPTSAIQKAKVVWDAMCDIDNNEVGMTHDAYLKIFQLMRYDLSQKFDKILVDEGQDISAASLAFLAHQTKCKIIIVGDPDQQIYRFRGAVDALSSDLLKGANRLTLSESFRFGSKIAALAKMILSVKDGYNKSIKGMSKDAGVILNHPTPVTTGCANIYRTNGGVIQAALAAVSGGHKVFWAGGLASYNLDDLIDYRLLYENKTNLIRNRSITAEFPTWKHLDDWCKKAKDVSLERVRKFVEETAEIDAIVEKLKTNVASSPDEENTISVTTAHKSKGLEWDNILLGDDFIELDMRMSQKEMDDELNLLYVAATRAKKCIVINNALYSIMVASEPLKQLYNSAK